MGMEHGTGDPGLGVQVPLLRPWQASVSCAHCPACAVRIDLMGHCGVGKAPGKVPDRASIPGKGWGTDLMCFDIIYVSFKYKFFFLGVHRDREFENVVAFGG